MLPEVLGRFKATVILAAGGMLLAFPLGIFAGVLSAVRQRSFLDRVTQVAAMVGISMPAFWVGLLLIIGFSVRLRWLPGTGMFSPAGEGGLADLVIHLILPAVTLATVPLAVVSRLTRTNMLAAAGEDYIRTARAKGASESRVIARHALRNALVPLVTILGLEMGFLLAGAVYVETVFSWPGIGFMLVNAILTRDFPLVQGGVLVVATTYVTINLATDLLYSYYGAIKQVTVVDPNTVRFTLKKPFSPLINNLTLNTGRIVSPAAVKKYGKEFPSHPVGTGPFKFVSWQKNVRIVLEANAGYWDGAPKLDRLIFRPLVEEQTRVTELLSGGVDFIVDVPPDNVEQVKKDARFEYYVQPGPHIWWVTLNTQKKPFSDVRVRRAANIAINKEAIAKDILKGTATAASGPIPPAITWAFTGQVTKYAYDPEKAKKLLTEAGYPNGFSAVFWIPESGSGMQSPKTMAQAIQADLQAVGIKVSIQTYEWGAYLNKYGKGFGQEADMGAMSFMLDPGDPAPMLSLVIDGKGGFNGGYYKNAEVDRLLDEATRVVDLKKRGELCRQATKIIVDDAPWVFIDNAFQNAAGLKKVTGFKLHPSFYIFFNKIAVSQ